MSLTGITVFLWQVDYMRNRCSLVGCPDVLLLSFWCSISTASTILLRKLCCTSSTNFGGRSAVYTRKVWQQISIMPIGSKYFELFTLSFNSRIEFSYRSSLADFLVLFATAPKTRASSQSKLQCCLDTIG